MPFEGFAGFVEDVYTHWAANNVGTNGEEAEGGTSCDDLPMKGIQCIFDSVLASMPRLHSSDIDDADNGKTCGCINAFDLALLCDAQGPSSPALRAATCEFTAITPSTILCNHPVINSLFRWLYITGGEGGERLQISLLH